MARERGVRNVDHTLQVDPWDPSEARRVAIKYLRKNYRLFDSDLNPLTPKNCMEIAIAGEDSLIIVMSEEDIHFTAQLERSVLASGEGATGGSTGKRIRH